MLFTFKNSLINYVIFELVTTHLVYNTCTFIFLQ